MKARLTAEAVETQVMTPTEPFTIASVAKTLGDLKKLPIADQALLLLKMLIHIKPQVRGTGGFSKHNLTMPGDSWGLAAGFPETENEAVRHHLLGVPWTRLVNEGFLVDPRGSGFFEVSEEGIAANIDKNKPAPVPDEKAPDGIPTAFISYSWDSDAHKDWVRTLAERLRSQGVRAILDQWELNAGGDRTHFMESNITASDFVIIICTPTYATKGNKRDGGVRIRGNDHHEPARPTQSYRTNSYPFCARGILMTLRCPYGCSRRSVLIYAAIPTTRNNMTFFFAPFIRLTILPLRLDRSQRFPQTRPT